MYKAPDKYTVYFDVDDTLVLWYKPESEELYSSLDEGAIQLDNYGEVWVMPHWKHIQRLKEFDARNHTIVVWSQGGSDWAAKVVKALKLERHVDAILSKPHKYYDDLDCEDFMGGRTYHD